MATRGALAGSALEQRQLESLEAGQRLRERHGRGRVLRGRFEERRVVENHERVAREPGREQDGGARIDPERQDDDLAERLDRALGRGVEETQRLDLVAHELGPHRPLARGREHVHDPASQAPLSDLDHGVHALVARGLEPAEERLALDRAADLQGEGARAELAGREQRGGERGRRRDHDDRAPERHVVAGPRALGRVVPMPAAPRGGLGGRELQHGRRGRAPLAGCPGRSGRPRPCGAAPACRVPAAARSVPSRSREMPPRGRGRSPRARRPGDKELPGRGPPRSSPSAAHRDRIDSEAVTFMNCVLR